QHQEEREEYEKKFRQQLVEMDRIQHSLKQLQDTHMLMKQQYEDEIVRLRRQLDAHPLKGDPDGRGGGGSSTQGVSGGMSMGSTGPGQSHSSIASPQKGLGGMPTHGLASPRKQQGQPEPGAASLRGPMLTAPPGSHMMGGGGGGMGGGGAGSGVVLPGMAMRGRGGPGEDDYGGRGLGPNGQTMEPLSKRPRLAGLHGPPGPLPPHGSVLHPPHGFSQQQQHHHPPQQHQHQHQQQQQQQQQQHQQQHQPHHHHHQGPGGGGNFGRAAAPPLGSISGGGSSGSNGGDSSNSGRRQAGGGQEGQHRWPGGGHPGPGGGADAPPPTGGSGQQRLGAGGGAPREARPSAAEIGGSAGGGSGMVDIPDAIPAELSYQVRFEVGEDGNRGSASARDGLEVELAKSQDLR
ncbi:unnamed protein product, partial [Hapterophycus canaliculatus]